VWEIDGEWRIVSEWWIIEWEIEDGWIFKSSRQNWMLVMHDGQWRLDMKNVVIVVSVDAADSLLAGGCSIMGGLMTERMERKGGI
jgi:hypothetical protein